MSEVAVPGQLLGRMMTMGQPDELGDSQGAELTCLQAFAIFAQKDPGQSPGTREAQSCPEATPRGRAISQTGGSTNSMCSSKHIEACKILALNAAALPACFLIALPSF